MLTQATVRMAREMRKTIKTMGFRQSHGDHKVTDWVIYSINPMWKSQYNPDWKKEIGRNWKEADYPVICFHFYPRAHQGNMSLQGIRLRIFDASTNQTVALSEPFKPHGFCLCELKDMAGNKFGGRAFGVDFDKVSFEEVYGEKLDA